MIDDEEVDEQTTAERTGEIKFIDQLPELGNMPHAAYRASLVRCKDQSIRAHPFPNPVATAAGATIAVV